MFEMSLAVTVGIFLTVLWLSNQISIRRKPRIREQSWDRVLNSAQVARILRAKFYKQKDGQRYELNRLR